MKKSSVFLSGLLICLLFASEGLALLSPDDFAKHREMKDEALKLFNQGLQEKALGLVNEVLMANPNDRTARRYLEVFRMVMTEHYCKQASDALEADRPGAAVGFWQEVLKVNPEDRRVVALLEEFSGGPVEPARPDYSRAHRLLGEKRLEQAVAEIERILLAFPNDPYSKELLDSARRSMADAAVKTFFEAADVYIEKKQYDLAIAELENLASEDKNQKTAVEGRIVAIKKMKAENVIQGYFESADAFAERGDYALAVAELGKVLFVDEARRPLVVSRIDAVRRMELDALYSEAEGLMNAGNYIASKEKYLKITAANPADEDVRKTLQKLDETIKTAPEITGKGAAWDALRKGLSHYISKSGNPKIALAAVWYAVQLEPGDKTVLSVRELVEGKLSGFIRSLETPVSGMSIIEQYLLAALNNIYAGRYDLAVDYCRIVLEFQPDSLLALKRLGSAYFAMGRKEEARQAWKKALDIAPKDKELASFISKTQ